VKLQSVVGFLDRTQSLLSTAAGENRFAISSNLTVVAYTWAAIPGGGRRVPLNNWSGGVNGIVSPKFVVFISTLRRLFCVCGSCWENLQPSPNPLNC